MQRKVVFSMGLPSCVDLQEHTWIDLALAAHRASPKCSNSGCAHTGELYRWIEYE